MVLKRTARLLTVSAIVTLAFAGCSKLHTWPESPLYDFPQTIAESPYKDVESVKEALVGRYAHYDVVAYDDTTTKRPMRTFIISYGFTDFFLDDGKLYQRDQFVHAEQKLNQPSAKAVFSDEAVQAIKPRVQEVEVSFSDGRWHIYRPATPTLLGVTGDPSKPLTSDPDDPNITDPDGDGNPGVTVEISIGSFLKGEIYILRREIYADYLTLNTDGVLYGHIEDNSEQFVIDASLRILRQPSNPVQNPDHGLSPILLVPIDDDIDTAQELMAMRDSLFPPEPEFGK